MGLSASQGRMLSLTSRLSDLEYRAQNISNQKMRLANDSEDVSNNYLDALNAKKVSIYNPETNTSQDGTLSSLYNINNISTNGKKRILVDASGNVVCPASVQASNPSYITEYLNQTGSNYAVNKTITDSDITTAESVGAAAKAGNESAFGSEEAYLNYMFDGNVPEDENDETLQYYKNIYSGLEAYAQSLGYTTASSDVRKSSAYQGDVYSADGTQTYFSNSSNVVQLIKNTYSDNSAENKAALTSMKFSSSSNIENDTEWLYQQLSMGNLFLVEKDDSEDEELAKWKQISWSSGDSQITTASDDVELAKAEAEYETAMNEIQAKDKRFDLELETIDTEHSAIQTEMDSISKVIEKNVERSFKIFS